MRMLLLKRSLKWRLVMSLSIVFILLWSGVFVWLYIDLKQRLQDTLDQRLSASTHMVMRLIQQLPLHHLDENMLQKLHQPDEQEHLIACEVSLFSSDISLGQQVIAKTRGAPENLSQHKIGLSTWHNGTVEWRSYVLRKGDLQVVAAERMFLRDSLLQQILQSVLVPLLLSLFLCITLIILIIRKEFRSLDQISQHLSQNNLSYAQATHYLTHLDHQYIPLEVQPFVDNASLLVHQLHQSLENEKAFSAYAAHELRSPLTAIKTHVQLTRLMAQQTPTSPSLQHNLDLADLSIRRYEQLLEQLLLITQIEQNQLDHIYPLKITDILEHVIDDLTVTYPQLEKKLVIDWASLNTLCLPEFVIYTICKNLIENAVLHAQASHIFVAMQGQNFIVEDDGSPLSAEDLEHLGQRFWRKSAQQHGHGLGLALVRSMLTQYGYYLIFSSCVPQGLNVKVVKS